MVIASVKEEVLDEIRPLNPYGKEGWLSVTRLLSDFPFQEP